ncbi:MAG: exodeoxyribonuclease VII small subunit [Gammaproteobacteria bacterium]|nr:exodeoxyribonuclease VII small subunit [Gammaproteobacteria bacterium]
MAKRKFNFENALIELEQTVDKMEEGDLSLEDSLLAFEKGIKLTRECQNALQQAEQKVSLLEEKNQQEQLIPFENDNEN